MCSLAAMSMSMSVPLPNPAPTLELTGDPKTSTPYSIREDFETKLRSIKNGALFVAGLQQLSRFFGICALTWATVVLLGGFASALRLVDFYFISILLLLEAARLSTTQVFSKLLVKTLFRERHRPQEFQFKDLQYFWASRLDLVGQISSGLFAMVSLGLAVARFSSSRHHPFTERGESSYKDHSNISPSLYTFYVLVMLNSATALASSISRLILRRSSEQSLMWYHDVVYKTAMNSGMPEADDIDIFEFAFKKLASDHMRNIRPPLIKLHNKDLIRYMYHSADGIGVACEYLKSGDVSKQVVAANLPGFWVKESRIKKQMVLFWALQDRLYGAGKVAEAAANSIQSLSKAWADQHDPHPFLISDPSKRDARNVVDTLINLLIYPIRPSLLFQLRALEGCCRSRQVLEYIYSQGHAQHHVLREELQGMIAGNTDPTQSSTPTKLCRKLESIVTDGMSTRQTTKMYAANMLHALLCFGGELGRDAKEILNGMVQDHIHPAKFGEQEYVWLDEKEMLDGLCRSLGLPIHSKEQWKCVRVLQSDGTDAPLPVLEQLECEEGLFAI